MISETNESNALLSLEHWGRDPAQFLVSINQNIAVLPILLVEHTAAYP